MPCLKLNAPLFFISTLFCFLGVSLRGCTFPVSLQLINASKLLRDVINSGGFGDIIQGLGGILMPSSHVQPWG